MKKITLGLIVIIMITLTTVKFVNKEKNISTSPTRKVTINIAQEVEFGMENVFGATVKGINEAVLSAQASGNIERVYVKEGNRVQRGQLLAVIGAPEIMARYRQAGVNVEILKEQEKRARRDWKDYKPEEKEQFKLQTEQARLRQNEAGSILAKTRVIAPFDGVIARRFVKSGATVTVGKPIISIVGDLKEKEIIINVPVDIGKNVQIGDVMQVKNKQEVTQAKVREISPVSDLQTRKITIHATLDPAASASLGDFVDVVVVNNNKILATTVSQKAVVKAYNDSFVFIVEDGVARMNKITVLHTDGEKAVISGIKKGAMVVASGAHDIGDGEKINIIEN